MAGTWCFCVKLSEDQPGQKWGHAGLKKHVREGERRVGDGSSDLFSLHVSCSPASALQFLHQRNISHLDLKPQNILLSSLEKPHLKLAGVSLEQQGKAGPGSPQPSVSCSDP